MFQDFRNESGETKAVVSSAAEIEEEVFRALRTLRPRGTVVRPDQRLIADLRLLSDDATAMAIELEHKFRVRIPREEWRSVLTVQDVVDLVVRHCLSSPG